MPRAELARLAEPFCPQEAMREKAPGVRDFTERRARRGHPLSAKEKGGESVEVADWDAGEAGVRGDEPCV